MAIRRITLADLVFGEPLRWDLFGAAEGANAPAAAAPVLQKGALIAPGPQLDTLLAAGLYAEANPPPSVLHSLNHVNQRLERMLLELRKQSTADAELRDIARELIAAVELDTDIALASIFLNQIAGLYAVRHCVETAIVVVLIARAMHKSDSEILTATAAALTMNVGMVRQIEGFQCKDCALSSEERAVVRRHPHESAELLRGAGVIDQEWLNYVLLHHENDDGSGYPEGKLGDEIPQNAKLIGLADRYCAHVSARNYRRSLLPSIALRNLFVDGDAPVDPVLASLFVEQIGKYPPGSLVRLANGEVGVVAHRGAGGQVTVHALRTADGKTLPAAAIRHCAEPEYAIDEALHEDQVGVRFSMKHIWGELASL